MKMSHWIVAIGVVVLIGAGALALADDAPASATPPTTAPSVKEFKMSVPELLKSLPDLTDDEKGKIEDLHKTADDAMRKLYHQEREDVWAVLSDSQKQEVVDAEEAAAKARKEAKDEARLKRDEEKASQDSATTQPSPAQ